MQKYKNRPTYARKTNRKLSFLQNKIPPNQKKFSKTFCNSLIFNESI